MLSRAAPPAARYVPRTMLAVFQIEAEGASWQYSMALLSVPRLGFSRRRRRPRVRWDVKTPTFRSADAHNLLLLAVHKICRYGALLA